MEHTDMENTDKQGKTIIKLIFLESFLDYEVAMIDQ
jgi:hypothetical protein